MRVCVSSRRGARAALSRHRFGQASSSCSNRSTTPTCALSGATRGRPAATSASERIPLSVWVATARAYTPSTFFHQSPLLAANRRICHSTCPDRPMLSYFSALIGHAAAHGPCAPRRVLVVVVNHVRNPVKAARNGRAVKPRARRAPRRFLEIVRVTSAGYDATAKRSGQFEACVAVVTAAAPSGRPPRQAPGAAAIARSISPRRRRRRGGAPSGPWPSRA